MAELTNTSLQKLLERLDPDPDKRGDKYNDLRNKIIFKLRRLGSLPAAWESLADKTIDVLAKKIDEGEEIINVYNYASGVAVNVYREHNRKYKENNEYEELPEPKQVLPNNRPNWRKSCLDVCLVKEIDKNDQRILLAYYNTDVEEKLKAQREALARDLKIDSDALRQKMCRLRTKLRKCVIECEEKNNLRVTK